ncbi:MAG: 50S ribosome-binding GTPase, partial [Treponema sp.]|nr:50S ribosome-binding GTPase [Treponema sp.]
MAKAKRKPDFSKPKPQKSAEVVEQEEVIPQTVEAEFDDDSDDWNIEDTSNIIEDSEEYAEYKKAAQNEGYDTSKYYVNLPLVVIAGRPNVGKSTLFNRFMHRRLAIVDPTPGVTRDPVEATAFIMGKPVRLVDTGGYKLDRDPTSRESEMDELVVQKTLATIKEADKILFLLEAGTITGEDEEFIHLLRPYWDKLIVAVNKCEGGKGESVAWNYLQYGFKDLLFISADHGDHITDLAKKITENLDFSKVEEGEKPQEPIRIAILGKPNTGKSTLSNRLTHSEKSIVSDYAGTTRDVVEGKFQYAGRNFEIMDTAGIRRKKKVHENVEYYSVNRAI